MDYIKHARGLNSDEACLGTTKVFISDLIECKFCEGNLSDEQINAATEFVCERYLKASLSVNDSVLAFHYFVRGFYSGDINAALVSFLEEPEAAESNWNESIRWSK